MISFASPICLGGLLILPLLFWWWRRRSQPAILYSDIRLIENLPRGRARWVPHTRILGRLLVLTLLILAAAGPRTPDEQTRMPVSGVSLAIVLDVSGSMATDDFIWETGTKPISRIEASRRVFRLLIEGGESQGLVFQGRPSDQMALVAFAAWPTTVCPLTLNRSVLLTMLDALQPRSGIDAGTNIGDAIAEGLIRLNVAGDQPRALILLSDGEHNIVKDGKDAPLKPMQAAQLAANLKIPIFAIDCGGEPSQQTAEERREQRKQGRAVLQDVVTLTGGRLFLANNGSELRAACEQIDQWERKPIESYQYRQYHEHADVFALAGFGIMAILAFMEATRWKSRPL